MTDEPQQIEELPAWAIRHINKLEQELAATRAELRTVEDLLDHARLLLQDGLP